MVYYCKKEIEINEEDIIAAFKNCTAQEIFNICIAGTSANTKAELRQLFKVHPETVD